MNSNLLPKKKYTVKDYIAFSLLELMETKPFNQISITELCENAKVSRVSFYRNFNYLEDPIRYYLKEDIEIWWTETFSQKEDISIQNQFLRELFKHYLKQKNTMLLLKKNHLLILLKDAIYLSGGPLNEVDENTAYNRAALYGAIYGVLEEWIKRGMKSMPNLEHLSWRKYE